MFILRFLWAVLTSRWLWTLIGLALLSLVIWVFGPIVRVGDVRTFRRAENVRIVIIALLVIFWLIWLIVAQRRAIRANRMFVAEIAAPAVEKPLSPGEENVAAVGAKFAEVMAELKRRKLGGRKFLREMPWYVIVGPPATGKTTALRPVRAELPDRPHRRPARGRRHAQLRLVLFRKRGADRHRRPLRPAGEPARRRRRGMAGLPRPVEEAPGPPGAERRDRRACRSTCFRGRRSHQGARPQDPPRLAELNDRLEIRLPVYLMLTKADLIKGFEAFFGGLVDRLARAGLGNDLRARRARGRQDHRAGNLDAGDGTRAAAGATPGGRGQARRPRRDLPVSRPARKPVRTDPGAGRGHVRRKPI